LSEKTPNEEISSTFQKPEYFSDLILVVIYLLVSILLIYIPGLNTLPLRYVLTLPLVTFLPGYCLIAALFPENDEISLIERIALSFGFSIALVPLIGLGLNFTPWGIRLDPVVISLTVFSLSMTLIAWYRRATLPSEKRFIVTFHALENRIRGIMPSGDGKIDRFLSMVLVFVVLISILTTIFVIVFPKEGEQFTEFYILGENGTAHNYPDIIRPWQNYPMYVGVANHEQGDIQYTIETWLLLYEFDNVTNSSRVLVMDPDQRLSFTLSDNETTLIPYNLSVRKNGYNRVEFLLFKDRIPLPDVTGPDRINASYRNVNLWFRTV
jgi:uncharacterized membrane protein